MKKRLFKGDHPDVARGLGYLAFLYKAQGKLAAAEPLYKDALAMKKRLFKGDHPDVARSLSNLATLYVAQGKLAAAEPLYRDALAMNKRLVTSYAKGKSEGETLTFTTTQQLTRGAYLTVARSRAAGDPIFDPGTAYPAVWSTKGMVARVYEQRQLQARAAATDAGLAAQLDALATARRRRAELLLAPATTDPGTAKKRADDLKALDRQIAAFDASLSQAFPPVARLDKLDAATAADLQQALPADAALVDYIRYTFFEWDDTQPAGEKEKRTDRYVAFVVTRDRVTWVDLDTEAAIGSAVEGWRAAIDSGRPIPTAVPGRVHDLVWAKVRAALPATVTTVYICPDADLCKVPFAALPGDQPGTILLEDFALATVPHAPFLLDQLWPRDDRPNPPTRALVVGGVKYDADVTSPSPTAVASRGDPLLKPGQKLGWGFLDNTVGELNGVAAAAATEKLPVTRFEGDAATTAAVLRALPKAKVAHFATQRVLRRRVVPRAVRPGRAGLREVVAGRADREGREQPAGDDRAGVRRGEQPEDARPRDRHRGEPHRPGFERAGTGGPLGVRNGAGRRGRRRGRVRPPTRLPLRRHPERRRILVEGAGRPDRGVDEPVLPQPVGEEPAADRGVAAGAVAHLPQPEGHPRTGEGLPGGGSRSARARRKSARRTPATRPTRSSGPRSPCPDRAGDQRLAPVGRESGNRRGVVQGILGRRAVCRGLRATRQDRAAERKLALPALQVNIARKQVNVVNPPAGAGG